MERWDTGMESPMDMPTAPPPISWGMVTRTGTPFRAAAPSGYLTNLGAVAFSRGPQDGEQNFHGQLAYGFNHLGIILLRAPSPFLQVNTQSDFFPFHGAFSTRLAAREVYEAIGQGGRFACIDAPGPHSWPPSSRAASIDWMRRWLMDAKDLPQPGDPSYRELDYTEHDRDFGLSGTKEANATPTGCVLDLPGARSAYDLMRDDLARLEFGEQGKVWVIVIAKAAEAADLLLLMGDLA